MAASLVLLLAFLIGVVCGLRSMMGPAVVCWAAHLEWLELTGSRLAFLASPISLVLFSLLAIGELIADKTSKIPPRTKAPSLVWRVLMGGLCGGAIAAAGEVSLEFCCLLGGLGGLMGAFAGYLVRHAATAQGRLPDLPVALCEDLIAVAGGLFLVSRF
jgi:uncharacterized membrane protein